MIIDLEKIPRSLFPWGLESNLRSLVMPYKMYGHFLAALKFYFQADAAFLYRGTTGWGGVDAAIFEGDGNLRDDDLVEEFAAARRPRIPRSVLLAPVRANARLAAVAGVARRGRDFALGKGRKLNRLCTLLGNELARRQEERLERVLDRIKEKVLSELRPRDLSYQILDGLHQLVHYDHSSALLIYDEEHGVLRVDAEKIVWTKSKSGFIGHEIAIGPELAGSLSRCSQARIIRADSIAEADRLDRSLHDLLDYSRGKGIPRASSVLCVPLYFGNDFLGVLKVAASESRDFDSYDAEVVERFLPAARVALRNARVKVSMENIAMQAELRAGLTTLARAVAHDVNNAVGAILPLAEQNREDIEEGVLDERELIRDLDVVISKASLCRRIFSNMLRVGSDRAGLGPVDVNELVGEMTALLESVVGPRGIELELVLAKDLPMMHFSKQHLERIVWNLVSNSAEALGHSGSIRVVTRRQGDEIVLSVVDNGPGIDPEYLDQVLEPFFTTKPNGTGLGLSICRSLVWQHGGAIELESRPGQGTSVEIRLPTVVGN